MKKFIALCLSMVLVLGLAQLAGATTYFTMTPFQLQSLYETYENPDHTGTFLNFVQAFPGGAKYTGNVRTNDPGWGQLQIGANFWGTAWKNLPGYPKNTTLGMGSLAGYTSYNLLLTNMNESPWDFNLYFNVGYTDLGEPDYYIQNKWTSIANGSSKEMVLDFTNAEVWKNGSYLGWQDLTTLGFNWNHISNIGMNVGGNMPVDGEHDYTFEFEVHPIPEPGTLLLLGSGLVGFGIIARIRRKRS